jgi:hypothetical protein
VRGALEDAGPEGGPMNRQDKDVEAAVKRRPVRDQQHLFRTKLENRMVPWAAGWAQEETVNEVQPVKISRKNHALRESPWSGTRYKWNQGRGLAGAGL